MADRDENYGGQKTRVVIIKIEHDRSICIYTIFLSRIKAKINWVRLNSFKGLIHKNVTN